MSASAVAVRGPESSIAQFAKHVAWLRRMEDDFLSNRVFDNELNLAYPHND